MNTGNTRRLELGIATCWVAAVGWAACRPHSTAAPAPPHGPLPAADAPRLFPQLVEESQRYVYDPQTYFWEVPRFPGRSQFPEHPAGSWPVGANELGFRKAREVSPVRPDLRILITGDSHTQGVVPVEETFAEVTETMLRGHSPQRTVETLNGGKGGYSFYNYLGVLEKHLHLRPHVFVVAVYGGNDFADVLALHRYFRRLPPPLPRSRDFADRYNRVRQGQKAWTGQCAYQVMLLAGYPEPQHLALEAATTVTAEIARICAANGIRLLCVYIPPVIDVQPQYVAQNLEELRRTMGYDEGDLAVTHRVASRYLETLRARGIAVVDVSAALASSPAPCFWATDLHLNTLGHRLVAEQLTAAIAKGT